MISNKLKCPSRASVVYSVGQLRSRLKISLSADNKIKLKLDSLHAKSIWGFANRGSSGLNPNYS